MTKKPDDHPPARARIEVEVRDMMTTGTWRGGRSHHELATKHGVSSHWVKQVAGEVGRELKKAIHGASQEEKDAAVGRILARLEETRELAISRTRTWTNREGETIEAAAPDFRTAVEIDKLELTLLGEMVQRHEHKDVTEERKKLAEMTAEERIALHEQAIAEERAKLAEGVH